MRYITLMCQFVSLPIIQSLVSVSLVSMTCQLLIQYWYLSVLPFGIALSDSSQGLMSCSEAVTMNACSVVLAQSLDAKANTEKRQAIFEIASISSY